MSLVNFLNFNFFIYILQSNVHFIWVFKTFSQWYIDREFMYIETIAWSRAWQPTPAFLPGESYQQRSLVGLHWPAKRWTQMKGLGMHAHVHIYIHTYMHMYICTCIIYIHIYKTLMQLYVIPLCVCIYIYRQIDRLYTVTWKSTV